MLNDLIITGIPRSGTSYICSILNKVNDLVVINEPDEVFQLMHSTSTIQMPILYDAIRERINKKLPIKNKIVNGNFIEDTNIIDEVTEYTPNVNSENFLLGTKNTLIYLNTLDRIHRQFNDITIVACVRHPIDTIASWSNVSFPHIKNANPEFLLQYCAENEKDTISNILQDKSLPQRYARWWDYLVNLIDKNMSNLILVRYEDMVENPQKTINQICDSIPFNVTMKESIEPSSPRSHRDKLDKEVITAINKYCAKSAVKLGYNL